MTRDKIALHKLCNEFEDEELVEELVDVVVMESWKQSDRVVKEEK